MTNYNDLSHAQPWNAQSRKRAAIHIASVTPVRMHLPRRKTMSLSFEIVVILIAIAGVLGMFVGGLLARL